MENGLFSTTPFDGISFDNPFMNGSKGKPYNCTFTIPEKFANFQFSGLAEIGLNCSFSPENPYLATVSGIPTKSGEFQIIFQHTPKQNFNCCPAKPIIFPIFINPDPRDLWKNIPTDMAIEYYKADSATDYVLAEGIQDLVAASQRGRSHAHEGKPRDDDFGIDHLHESGWYIQIVADGAGSAMFSREGSRLAVKNGLESCRTSLKDNPYFEKIITNAYCNNSGSPDFNLLAKVREHAAYFLANAAIKAHKAIQEEADSKGRNIKEYATTFLIAISKKFDFGWFVASFGIGDGAMAAYGSNDGKIFAKLLAKPDEGEFGGQTRFLTMREIMSDKPGLQERTSINLFPSLTAVLLMSDGVSDAKFETAANLNKPEKWTELWQDICQNVNLARDNYTAKDELLRWLDFWSVGNHDDRTITILY